jgi:hemerythrin superfamily protein
MPAVDAIIFLETQHREVDELMDRLERLQTEAAGTGVAHLQERTEIADQILRKLSVHAVIEEEYFYPLLRKHLGDEPVERALAEQQEQKDLLHEIDGKSPDAETYDEHVRALIALVREHVRYEESDLFPRIRDAVDGQVLEDLADTLRKAAKLAPTRPHPHAPNTPPGNKLLGPPVAVMDKARDALMGR